MIDARVDLSCCILKQRELSSNMGGSVLNRKILDKY